MKTAAKSLVLLAVLGAMLALAPTVMPYNQQQVNGEGSGGPGVHWASMPITVVINSNGSDDVPLNQAQNAIRAAWATLSSFSTASVSFHEDTNAADQARTDYNNGINLYYFDETGSTGLFGNSPSGAVAITPNSFQLNGDIIDASVIFNGRDYTFSTSGGNGTIDIQSVATHESEHLLGFDHTGDYTATLFPITFDNITRHPSPDDVAGISTVYPSGTYNTTYGSISGTVKRSAGTAVQAAQVVALNLNGVVIETGYTDQSGNFTLKGLVAGGYTLYVEPVDGPMYNYNVSFNQVDTDFSATYLGGNSSPQVVNVTAGQVANVGTITVAAAFAINITDGTPVTARQGQSVSVVISGSSLDTATNGGIPGSGITITNITVLSAQQVQFDLTIAANAPLGARSITLSDANGNFEPITGVLYVEDANGNTLNYPSGGVTPPSITTSALPNGQVGVAYNQTLQGSGGTPPYTWSITQGSLPAGLTLTASSGLISGTPTTAGTANFTVQLRDANNVSTTRALSITVTAAGLTITTSALPNGQVGQAYSQTLQASGGTPPYTWSISSGALPGGLALAASTGTISGTPTTAGTFNFTAHVADSAGSSANQALSITITPSALTITTNALPNGQVNVAYSQTLQASGGTPPYSWSVASGSLPPGLAMSGSGTISGTPTTAGTYSFTAHAADSGGQNANQALSITINPAVAGLTVTTSALPNGQVGAAYSQTLQASGGTPPYTWSISSGSLPAGTTLSSSGTISGTPTTAGTFSFTAQVADSAGNHASRALAITISAAALSVTTSALPNGQVGVAYSQTLSASGGTPPYTWTVLSGSLPAGTTLSSSGTISGSPTTAGTSNFTVQATDSAGQTASRALSITVNPAAAAQSGGIVLGLGSGSYGYYQLRSYAAGNFASLGWHQVVWSAYDSARGETRIAMGDVDGDGMADFVIGLGSYPTAGGYVEVVSDAGQNFAILKWLHVPNAAYDSADGETWPAVGDVDGDGKAEILLGQGAYPSSPGHVWIFGDAGAGYAYQGAIIFPWSGYNSLSGETHPACGDLNGDGKAEVVIGQGSIYPNSAGGYSCVLGNASNGYALQKWIQVPATPYNTHNGLVRPAIGDLDGDGKCEIVVGQGTYTAAGGSVWIFQDAAQNYAYARTLTVPWSSYNSSNGSTRPAVGDVDGDGRADIIVGLGTGSLGYVNIIGDTATGYANLGWIQAGWSSYDSSNGTTWPAVGRFQ